MSRSASRSASRFASRFAFLGLAAAGLALTACIVPAPHDCRTPAPDWQPADRSTDHGGTDVSSMIPPVPDQELAPPILSEPRPTTPVRPSGVVDGFPQGRVQSQDGSPRELEGQSGRTHIIELYQQAVDERDALASSLEELHRKLVEANQALELRDRENAELTARVASLETAQKDLLAENGTLASRLVQAQIRRLEAEKLLLETRLEQERASAESARKREGSSPERTTPR